MDYTMPRAHDLPSFKLGYRVTPGPHNPLGVKGCGEAGAIAAPAAVMNAVMNALSPLGVRSIDMPATAPKIWAAINNASMKQAAE
jgi:carbon-monoxide dehydrogenase large subunit